MVIILLVNTITVNDSLKYRFDILFYSKEQNLYRVWTFIDIANFISKKNIITTSFVKETFYLQKLLNFQKKCSDIFSLKRGADIALYLSIVFHYIFQIAPRGDRRIYLVVISYYTALVSPCGIHYIHTCSLRLELSGCWFAFALSLRRRAPAPKQ